MNREKTAQKPIKPKTAATVATSRPTRKGSVVPSTNGGPENQPSGEPGSTFAKANEAPLYANHEVLTLTETAAFMRLGEDEVVDLVLDQAFPGRIAGAEWRFSKSAIQEWLRAPIPTPSREAQRSIIGSFKNDPYWEEELKEIYKRRGRPMTENEDET